MLMQHVYPTAVSFFNNPRAHWCVCPILWHISQQWGIGNCWS